jgi:septal ring factor EnvC (AmiA/AmiB activator)
VVTLNTCSIKTKDSRTRLEIIGHLKVTLNRASGQLMSTWPQSTHWFSEVRDPWNPTKKKWKHTSAILKETKKSSQRLQKKTTGMRQNLTGAERQRLAENYFYSRPLEEQRMLAKEIAALRGMKSESRFRTKVLQLLARTFISGVKVD